MTRTIHIGVQQIQTASLQGILVQIAKIQWFASTTRTVPDCMQEYRRTHKVVSYAFWEIWHD